LTRPQGQVYKRKPTRENLNPPKVREPIDGYTHITLQSKYLIHSLGELLCDIKLKILQVKPLPHDSKLIGLD